MFVYLVALKEIRKIALLKGDLRFKKKKRQPTKNTGRGRLSYRVQKSSDTAWGSKQWRRGRGEGNEKTAAQLRRKVLKEMHISIDMRSFKVPYFVP